MKKNNILTYGGGVNSVALAIEMVKRRMPIDYIIFSDTLAEKPETYAYNLFFSDWLVSKGYPAITHLPPYREEGLYGECIRLKRLPSIVYGFKSCSEKWKIRPFDKFCRENGLFPAIIYKGIDAGESHRLSDYSDKEKEVFFPLVDWEIDRMGCVKIIIDERLPLPPKSSCFFCPSMKKNEVYELQKHNPKLFKKAIEMEENAAENLITVKGLMRDHAWGVLTQQQRIEFDTPIHECQICSL